MGSCERKEQREGHVTVADSWVPVSLTPGSLAAVNHPLKGDNNASAMRKLCSEQDLDPRKIREEQLGDLCKPPKGMPGNPGLANLLSDRGFLTPIFGLIIIHQCNRTATHRLWLVWPRVPSAANICSVYTRSHHCRYAEAELCRALQQTAHSILQIIALESCFSGKNVVPAQPKLLCLSPASPH